MLRYEKSLDCYCSSSSQVVHLYGSNSWNKTCNNTTSIKLELKLHQQSSCLLTKVWHTVWYTKVTEWMRHLCMKYKCKKSERYSFFRNFYKRSEHCTQIPYRSTIFACPIPQYLTQSGCSCLPYNCWHDEREESNDPWYSHADSGHPVAIVLPMSNCMNNLEVSFQGDNNKTDLPTRYTKHWLKSEVMLYSVIY